MSITLKGSLTGSLTPLSTIWGDPPVSILIASGGLLQKVQSDTLSTISGSPTCDIVLKKGGRVVVASGSSNTVKYSGVGDETNWTSGTSSDSVELEVGYKSGGTINAMCPMGNDLIVFKTDGAIYRVISDYPDWSVVEIGRNMYNLNRFSAVQMMNDVLFLDRFHGIRMISAVQEYGDVKAGPFGEKINSALVSELGDTAMMWYLPSRAELWVKLNSGMKKVYVYNFQRNAWTTFEFPLEPVSAMSVGTDTYISVKGEPDSHPDAIIAVLDPNIEDDFDVDPIETDVMTRVIPARGSAVLLGMATVDLGGTGNASLLVNDIQIGSLSGAGSIITRQGIIGRTLSMRIVSPSGRVSVRQIVVNYGEI